jgi:hypothetical protein
METTIVLDRPDEKWGKTLRYCGTCAYNLTTPDDGTTWKIQILAMAPHYAPQGYTKTGYRAAGTAICEGSPTDYWWWSKDWYPYRPSKICYKDKLWTLCEQP